MMPSLLLFLFLLSPLGSLASGSHGWSFSSPDRLGPDGLPTSRPLIIGHRGASGMYPEHTSLSYIKASEQGADVIECDVTVTKDLELVCSHNPWIGDVCNLGEFSHLGRPHADFSSREETYNLDDGDDDVNWNDKGDRKGFFTFDFTLAELKMLRRRQARDYRDPKYDWQYSFVSFPEYLNMSRVLGFGVYPEIKLGYATNEILRQRGHGVTLEELVLKDLTDAGYHRATDPALIQTYELSTLKALRAENTDLRLVMLVDTPGKVSNESLDEYRRLGVHGIGVDKDLIVFKGEDGHIRRTDTDLIGRLHSFGFKVHAFTFRNEPRHLPWDYGQDMTVEYQKYLDLRLDGYFTDFPGSLRRFMDDRKNERMANGGNGVLVNMLGMVPVMLGMIVSNVLT